MTHLCFACEEHAVPSKDSICLWCMQEYKFDHEDHGTTQVGVLIGGNFYCDDCASWFPVEPSGRVVVANIKFYSQVCTCCRNVIYKGSVPTNLLKAPYSASLKVLQ